MSSGCRKIFKSLSYYKNIKFKKVHDLVYLNNASISVDADFNEISDPCSLLNGYYIESRYPLDIPINYSVEDARKAVDIAHDIRNFISQKIEK